MLFTNILLSVWFVIWLANSAFVRDVLKLFVNWIEDFYEDDETDEQEQELIQKAEDKAIYHLLCPHCNHMWWSIESNVNYCPNCGEKFEV